MQDISNKIDKNILIDTIKLKSDYDISLNDKLNLFECQCCHQLIEYKNLKEINRDNFKKYNILILIERIN